MFPSWTGSCLRRIGELNWLISDFVNELGQGNFAWAATVSVALGVCKSSGLWEGFFCLMSPRSSFLVAWQSLLKTKSNSRCLKNSLAFDLLSNFFVA